jgi:zinc transport system substrate-binding protein
MKKLFALILLFLFSNIGFSQVSYVTTLHPFKEIINAVVGERGEVNSILPPGASPHTYQLKPSDMRKVESATALIIGGHNLDEWALKFQNSNKLELIDLIPKSEVMDFEFVEEHAEEHNDQQHHHHEGGNDPHFWTDPLVVKSLLPQLVDKLGKIDPEGSESYKKNAQKFAEKLDDLYLQIQQKLSPIRGKKVMLSHPFFRYFLKRFEIELVGITESSPGKEPTPKEIKGMIEQVKNENVKAIFCHIQLPDRAAKLVGEAAKINVFALDPIGGVKGRQTYEEILLYNANILLESLR